MLMENFVEQLVTSVTCVEAKAYKCGCIKTHCMFNKPQISWSIYSLQCFNWVNDDLYIHDIISAGIVAITQISSANQGRIQVVAVASLKIWSKDQDSPSPDIDHFTTSLNICIDKTVRNLRTRLSEHAKFNSSAISEHLTTCEHAKHITDLHNQQGVF